MAKDNVLALLAGGIDGTHWFYQALKDGFAELIQDQLQKHMETAVELFAI